MNDGHSGRLTEREIFIYHVVTWATSGGPGFDIRKLCPLLTSSQIDELLLDLNDEVQNFAINEAERKHDFKKLRQKPNSVADGPSHLQTYLIFRNLFTNKLLPILYMLISMFNSYEELLASVKHCEQYKTLLRYFDLKEIIKYNVYKWK